MLALVQIAQKLRHIASHNLVVHLLYRSSLLSTPTISPNRLQDRHDGRETVDLIDLEAVVLAERVELAQRGHQVRSFVNHAETERFGCMGERLRDVLSLLQSARYLKTRKMSF